VASPWRPPWLCPWKPAWPASSPSRRAPYSASLRRA
jgi:hypothetical protein